MQADMWLHLILVVMTQCCTAMRDNLGQTLAGYLTTRTERGYEGEEVEMTCDPGNKVTTQTQVDMITTVTSLQHRHRVTSLPLSQDNNTDTG